MRTTILAVLTALATMLLIHATPLAALQATVTVENLSPESGTYITPTWVGAHDGSFDIYDLGTTASAELERLAEDGARDPLSATFLAAGPFTDGEILGTDGPIGPGEKASITLDLDPTLRYLSYAAMVVPSNDAFIANDNPMAIPLFDELGTFIGGSTVVFGRQIRDAGTEVNDETPANTAFFGQATPDTGITEGGVVTMHPGFKATGMGGILDDAMFAAADFTRQGYRVARITVTAVQEVTVMVENLAAENGTFVTPTWIGFHDGSFDVADLGVAASPEVERLAEDGNTGPLSEAFLASGAGMIDATIPGPDGPIAPGESARHTFLVDGSKPYNRYLTFASMVVPSNDAFITNGESTAIPVFDAQGNFLEGTYVVAGDRVYDAGTEINDEIPTNTAFFGQEAPDTGTAEGGVVIPHPGFLPTGGILDDAMFTGADFLAAGYHVAQITVTTSGEPSVYLGGDRFRVSASFVDPADGTTVRALGKARTDDSATFTFFDEANVELLVKVLDGCGVNGRVWVYSSGLTNVQVDILVEDLEAGTQQVYASPGGVPFEPIFDLEAFDACE